MSNINQEIVQEVAYKCKNCGRLTYPKRVRCLNCKSQNFEKVPFPEYGEVLTFTQVFQLPWGVDDRFLTLGIIKFDNGVKTMGRITSPDIKTGTKVKGSWEKIRVMNGEDVYGWSFTPVN